MALIDCPECGHQVSDQADACPSCGLGLAELRPNHGRGSQSDQRQTELRLELVEIDMEWERERPKYLVNRGPWGGGGQAPTKRMASQATILMPIFAIAIGIGFAVITPDPVVGLFKGGVWAVVFLVWGLAFHWWGYRKAVRYEEAEIEFQRRKEDARAKYETKDQTQPNESAS
ncbi:MAG: zinc ribbon domain-containing protein [Candidatus Nealsonbacteria bacterium]|nr:zinc ribbon domain-containing protein [Candidatus Nealsonbacteria bacterium]